jgi:heterodisulfide reductase subunit A
MDGITMSISVFICNCGGTLEDAIDTASLAEFARGIEGVGFVVVDRLLCRQSGLELLSQHIIQKRPKNLVIAACSKNLMFPYFEKCVEDSGLDPYRLEMVNLREHCAWVHPAQRDVTLAKAKRMLYTAVKKAELLEPTEVRKLLGIKEALVIGGGVAGIQASLDLASQGVKVHLVERSPSIGGKMALLVKTYPTDDCAICILGPKMAEVAASKNVDLLTYAEVKEVKRYPGGFQVKILKKPRYVDEKKCTGCGMCTEKCPIKAPNEWNGGLGFRKAIYLPFPQALPRKYTIDPKYCLYFTRGVCRVCEKICPAKALDFEQKAEEIELDVGAIIVATGFTEYSPINLQRYGFGKLKDVITQFQLARILDPSGPTGGKLIRFSDLKKPKDVVMIQCVGSRDPQVNRYCSQYCCMAAIKHAILIKIEQDPQINITIMYKDVRAMGKGFEEYYVRARDRFGVKFVKGDVISVSPSDDARRIKIDYETENGEKHAIEADMVVLSCAMRPPPEFEEQAKILGIELDPNGFFKELDSQASNIETNVPGIYVCGCCQGPKDIPESVVQASAAAYRAYSWMTRLQKKILRVPEIYEDLCSGCGVCKLICPYEAISFDEKGLVKIDEIICQGCGLCGSSCPTKAIQLINNRDEHIMSQIHAVLTDKIEGPKPLVLAFCCEECAYTLLDETGIQRKVYPPNVIPIFLPCLSVISTAHVFEALLSGADAVLIAGCPEERCHYGAGTARARVKVLQTMLKDLGVPSEKIVSLSITGSSIQEFVSTAEKIVKSMEALSH